MSRQIGDDRVIVHFGSPDGTDFTRPPVIVIAKPGERR